MDVENKFEIFSDYTAEEMLLFLEKEGPGLKDTSEFVKSFTVDKFVKCHYEMTPRYNLENHSIIFDGKVYKFRAFEKRCLADTQYFHPRPVRSIAAIRKFLRIPQHIWLDPVAVFLRRTKHIAHYYFHNNGLGYAKIKFYPLDLPVAPGAFSLIQDTYLDSVMQEFKFDFPSDDGDLNEEFLNIRHKRKLSEAGLKFRVLERKKRKTNCKAPDKIPIPTARTGPGSKYFWTGRVRFYKNWIYEVQHENGTVTEVLLSSLQKSHLEWRKKYANYVFLPGYNVSKKYKQFTEISTVLKDVYKKVRN